MGIVPGRSSVVRQLQNNVTEQGDVVIELLDEAADVLSRFVVPLYVEKNGKPDQIGSGFFVRAGPTYFLVSAAHVLELGTVLFYYVEPKVTVHLSGDRRLSKWVGDRERDPVDVGTLKLNVALPPYPKVNKDAVDVSYLRSGLLPRSDKIYSIIGFPATQSRSIPWREVESTVYALRNRSIADSDYARHGLTPERNVVLPMNLKEGVDSAGKQRTFPKPQGMSGSPIWMLLEEGPVVGERSFPIVGIGTKYRKSERVLIGTDVDIAVHMIHEAV